MTFYIEGNPVLNDNNIIWKPVIGYEQHYVVSNTGLVKSIERKVRNSTISFRVVKEKMKTSNTSTTSDYLYVLLYKNDCMKNKSIHRLVAEAFITNPGNKPMVNHIDGNKLNNNVCNLEWVSSRENKAHAKELGLMNYNYPTKGKKFGNKSKYHNVQWDKSRNKWKAHISVNNKPQFQKRFDSEDEAALHVNWILDKLNITDRPRNVISRTSSNDYPAGE